jgi:hypothetical protein
MQMTKLIKNRHLYDLWFLQLTRYAMAAPNEAPKVIADLTKDRTKYIERLFKIGSIRPNGRETEDDKIFRAHLNGLQLFLDRLQSINEKHPELCTRQLVDARAFRLVADWSNLLAHQAAAYCNSFSEESDPFDDPSRCVDAWINFNDAMIKYYMEKADYDDCMFQNSNPPIPETEEEPGPYGTSMEIDPCLHQLRSMILAENNMNAAWDEIRVWCSGG